MKTEINRYDKKIIKKKLSIEKGVAKVRSVSVLYVFVTLLIFITIISFSVLSFLARPITRDGDFKYVEIKQGESTLEISRKLKEQGLIRSPYAFAFFSKISGKSIKAGHYKVSAKMGSKEILNKLSSGEVDAFSITIPEGYRALQIAKVLQEKESINAPDFINSAVGTEGRLFPDTYVFPKGLEPAKIVRMLLDNFETRTRDLNLTESDLILASLVEREAVNDEERPKIAKVYLNRIEKGMLLQADPTVKYGLDTNKYLENKSVDFDFWTPLTRAQIQELNSPFNTYKQRGLPPAPICNPGLKSIEATLNPEQNFEYVFFFHDKNQVIHFSNSYDEHLRQIQEFGVSG